MISDSFPLTPDYAMPMGYARDGILRGETPGKQFARVNAAPRRRWSLVFNGRPWSEWEQIEVFYRQVDSDFFLWIHPQQARHYGARFSAAPQHRWVGNENVDIACEIEEAAGVDLGGGNYPATPVVTLPPARFISTTTGLVIAYGGYGFEITVAGASDIELDGVSLAGVPATKYDVVLGLHRLEVQPNTAVITVFKVVA
jgi:hypothetical protein